MASLTTREGFLAPGTPAGLLVGIGVVVWFVATVLFRLVGHLLLPPGDALVITGVFVLTVPAMVILAFSVYSVAGVDPGQRVVAAALLVLPGLILDVLTIAAFGAVFPNIDPASLPAFAALLLLANAVVLLTGFLPRERVDIDVG